MKARSFKGLHGGNRCSDRFISYWVVKMRKGNTYEARLRFEMGPRRKLLSPDRPKSPFSLHDTTAKTKCQHFLFFIRMKLTSLKSATCSQNCEQFYLIKKISKLKIKIWPRLRHGSFQKHSNFTQMF